MDDDCIQQAQTGDPLAFRTLVEQYTPLIERTARVLLGDREAAADAVQEAWLDVWRGLSRFDCRRPFRPWLLALVTNRCRMLARRRNLPSVPLDERAEQLADPASNSIAARGNPLDEDLALALATLPAAQQRVVALRFFADLELAEIAAVTDTPLGTVKSRLHRALAMLQTQLVQQQHPTWMTATSEET